MTRVTKKVWAYIVRPRPDDVELLVFDHMDEDAGVQIPAGTVEPDENVEIAVKRELLEESGLRINSFQRLAISELDWNGVNIQAHLFAAWAPPGLANEWVHQVSGDGDDNGMRFRYYWLPHSEWSQLHRGFRFGYAVLNEFIANSLSS